MGRRTWGYIEISGGTYIGLGNKGISFAVSRTDDDPFEGKEKKVGTIILKKKGIAWTPSRGKTKEWSWDELSAI